MVDPWSDGDRSIPVLGVLMAAGAAGVDLVLWELYPLYFGPGVLLGTGAPLAFATAGLGAGFLAYERGSRRLGVAIVCLNLLGAGVGLVWVLGTRPSLPA